MHHNYIKLMLNLNGFFIREITVFVCFDDEIAWFFEFLHIRLIGHACDEK